MNELAAKISASEVEVLEVLWQADAPMPIAAIRAALEGGHQWDASTVKTLLRRLCEKGAVEAEKRGGVLLPPHSHPAGVPGVVHQLPH